MWLRATISNNQWFTDLNWLFWYFSDVSVEPGVNTKEVLLENGYTTEQIDQLINDEIIEHNLKSKL